MVIISLPSRMFLRLLRLTVDFAAVSGYNIIVKYHSFGGENEKSRRKTPKREDRLSDRVLSEADRSD